MPRDVHVQQVLKEARHVRVASRQQTLPRSPVDTAAVASDASAHHRLVAKQLFLHVTQTLLDSNICQRQSTIQYDAIVHTSRSHIAKIKCQLRARSITSRSKRSPNTRQEPANTNIFPKKHTNNTSKLFWHKRMTIDHRIKPTQNKKSTTNNTTDLLSLLVFLSLPSSQSLCDRRSTLPIASIAALSHVPLIARSLHTNLSRTLLINISDLNRIHSSHNR